MHRDPITGQFLPGARHDAAARLFGRARKTETCWLVPAGGCQGYGRFNLDGTPMNAHRAAWILATGTVPPRGLVVGHTCDVRTCIRNDDVGVYVLDGVEHPRRGHLWLGTIADNIRDMWLKGRAVMADRTVSSPRGERHWNAHLDADDVRAIRALRADGWMLKSLAQGFGVHVATVTDVVYGRTWTHV